jgi:predicted Rossmann fold flavoprotein
MTGGGGKTGRAPRTADIAVIGAGASGLMAAGCAAGAPLKVLLIEKNAVPGRKLSITGKGRCNLTNSADVAESVRNVPGNGKFLHTAFWTLPNAEIVAFFERLGVRTVLERGGRYFTQSGRAWDVTEALCAHAADAGADFLCHTGVAGVGRTGSAGEAGGFCVRLRDGRQILAKAVVLATGGLSYPRTGSTGDGYRFAESLGHTVVRPRASLVPLETVEDWPRALAGLTLKNVVLRLWGPEGKCCFEEMGELLFTHFGISGPLVLSGSRHLPEDGAGGFAGCAAALDLKPALSHETLCNRITRDFTAYAKKSVPNALRALLPARLIPAAVALSGLEAGGTAAGVGKAGKERLAATLKNLRMASRAPRPVAEAIVTAGGVRTSEINPSTMESKLVKGLYFCGELMDVDAYTGGFNLSIAFATGCLAGRSARTALLERLEDRLPLFVE